MRLKGKVALITGAANGVKGTLMGFGGFSAWLFANEGARVIIADIDEDTGKQSAAQIREAGYEAEFVLLDVTKEQDWINAIKTTLSHFSQLDILVNNAGIAGLYTVEDTSLEHWQSQMDINSTGVFLGTRAAIPEMRKVGGGSIINISSINGLIGSPTSTAYHAAKGASRIFTKAAAVQYAKEGIRINSVHPGYVTTPLTEKFFANPEVINPRLARVPMKRLGLVEEVANGILFLASDESSFITGAELVIDGGVTAH
jgi:NAD(P)-dependent dehydrogenase (short-subunit alcohol dehydrogenase family)